MHSLYSGFYSTLILSLSSYSTYFLVYRLGQKCILSVKPSLELIDHTVVSCIASVLCVVVNTPIWTINTKLMIEQSDSKGVVQCFLEILAEEGFLGLYKGMPSSLMLTSNPVIQFTLYEKAKEILGDNLSSSTYFLLATLTKFVATICTFPMLTIRTRQQLAKEPMSFFLIVRQVMKSEKFMAFYKGFSTKII